MKSTAFYDTYEKTNNINDSDRGDDNNDGHKCNDDCNDNVI